jgi:hypothetical protein
MVRSKNSGIFIIVIIIFLHSLFTYSCKKTEVPVNIIKSVVKVYPALPGNQYMSDRYEVNVIANDTSQNSYVYKDPVNDLRFAYDRGFMSLENHFTSFSFSGQIKVQVKLPLRTSITTAIVRPASKNLSTSISGNTITISLKDPANFYVEIDGENRYPLFIFANPQEVNIPSPNDPNVIYFGPGIHEIGYSGGTMQNFAVGKTVYLAGGAYVKGALKTADMAGTTAVIGRGILSGIDIPGYESYNGMIDVHTGILQTEGIIILDAPQGYQGIIAYGNGSVLRNIKMIAWAQGSDAGVLGINSQIINCFFKINDDVLKPVSTGILFKDNIVWHQMCGSVIMLGWNSVLPITNATVSGLDVIGCDRGVKTNPDVTSQSFLNLKNSNGATYKNFTIENVRMDKKPYMLFAVDILVTDPGFINNPNFNKGLGAVDGITFRNFTIPGLPAKMSYFNGNGNITPASTGDIKNITFENITISGTLLTEQNSVNYITRLGNTSNFIYK